MSTEVTFSIAGSTFHMGASAAIKRLTGGQPLALRREPTNKFHSNAVGVWANVRRPMTKIFDTRQLGYVPRHLADVIAPLMDAGVKVIARKANNILYGVCELAYNEPEVQQQKEVPDEPQPDSAASAGPLGAAQHEPDPSRTA